MLKRYLLQLAIVFSMTFLPMQGYVPLTVTDSLIYFRNGAQVSQPVFGQDDDVKKFAYFNSSSNTYTDYANGFQINIPRGMSVDHHLSEICTVFTNPITKIEVFYENFAGSVSNAHTYVNYGNRFLNNTRDHHVIYEEWLVIDDMSVHILKWERSKLKRIPQDKHYYASAEFIKNDDEVYTVLIKSSLPIENEKDVFHSFRFFERQGATQSRKPTLSSKTTMNTETKEMYRTFFSPNAPLRWGIFEPFAPAKDTHLTRLEVKLNYRFPVLLDYQSIDETVPVDGLQTAFQQGRFVELTFYTAHDEDVSATLSPSHIPRNAGIVYEILDGKYDAYLEQYAKDIKSFGHPILFRLNNEMNGDWCWYSAFYTSKDADLYKALWMYIRHTFDRHGVDNLIWVWNPHDLSKPDFKWNHYLMYYPGDEYVDVIGLTGYNTGTYFPGESWREFHDIYAPIYAQYRNHFNKPFMITEFGSNSVGGNKVAWIENMMNEIGQFDNIKLAIWWNGIDYDRQKQPARIYKVDENEKTLETFAHKLKEYNASP